jgi:hypothetical protein
MSKNTTAEERKRQELASLGQHERRSVDGMQEAGRTDRHSAPGSWLLLGGNCHEKARRGARSLFGERLSAA